MLSHHQGKPDFDKLAVSGVEFINTKASEGASFRDPSYPRHVQEARRVGMGIIAFHYWRPVGALTNLMNMLEATKNYPPDLYEIDFEVMGKTRYDTVQELIDFHSKLYIETMRIPVFYTNPNFGKLYYKYGLHKLTPNILHIANYDRGFPMPVFPWVKWDIWQSTQTARVLGLEGNGVIEITHTNFSNLVDRAIGKEVYDD